MARVTSPRTQARKLAEHARRLGSTAAKAEEQKQLSGKECRRQRIKNMKQLKKASQRANCWCLWFVYLWCFVFINLWCLRFINFWPFRFLKLLVSCVHKRCRVAKKNFWPLRFLMFCVHKKLWWLYAYRIFGGLGLGNCFGVLWSGSSISWCLVFQ